MFQSSIKLSKQMNERVKVCAQRAGYSSAQEFVEHVLDKELTRMEFVEDVLDKKPKSAKKEDSNEDLVRKLRGLGYID